MPLWLLFQLFLELAGHLPGKVVLLRFVLFMCNFWEQLNWLVSQTQGIGITCWVTLQRNIFFPSVLKCIRSLLLEETVQVEWAICPFQYSTSCTRCEYIIFQHHMTVDACFRLLHYTVYFNKSSVAKCFGFPAKSRPKTSIAVSEAQNIMRPQGHYQTMFFWKSLKSKQQISITRRIE